MAANAPWSVKGIDPKAREIAKGLARRSGMTLGEWLNQMILEDSLAPEDAPSAAAEPAPYPRFEAPTHPGDDVARITDALDRISVRIEAAESRTTAAINGIDQSVASILGRIEQAEREQTAVAARFEGAVAEIVGEQRQISERMQRMEQDGSGPRSVDAVRSIEGALAKVANHLYAGEAKSEQRFSALRGELDELRGRLAATPSGAGEAAVQRIASRLNEAEARTDEAMRSLQTSLARLDQRLGVAELRAESRSPEAGLEQLAVSLSARVDAVRSEMTEKIREAADARFERIERSLAEVSSHVDKAERRSAGAIERMGRDVLRMADTLGRRVQEVENRSADAIEQVGGQVARMASGMDARLAQTDEVNAKALEKLGGEIARITERLSERISHAERRSAQAMDEMGEQVTRVSERLTDRHERMSTELSERIRLSEERTARLLEDARERLDQRLEQTQKKLAEAPQIAAFHDPDIAPFGGGQADPEPDPPANAVAFRQVPFPQDDEALIASPLAEPSATSTPVEDLEAEAPALDARGPGFESGPRHDSAMLAEPPASAPEPGLPSEPRSFVDFDDAFAATQLEAASGDSATRIDDAPLLEPAIHPEAASALAPGGDASLDEDMLAAQAMAGFSDAPDAASDPSAAQGPRSTRELIEQTRAAARAANQAHAERRGGAARRPLPTARAKPRGPSAMITALMVSGGAAALSMALVGYEFVLQKPAGPLPNRVAQAFGLGAPGAPLASERPAAGEGNPQPLAAIALNPTPIAAQGPSAQQNEAAAEVYADGVRRLESHDNSGLQTLRRAANLGYAPAEFYLAKLYESGGAGLKKDVVEARAWTERAAEAGDVKAMHNLALDYFEGAGGPKDLSQAADWFHRAADQGLIDSQYNLARLYEEGFGVTRNPAEAYKWYLIAARAGDADSARAAQRLKSALSPEAQAAADRSARAFAPATASAAAAAAAAPASASAIATAQRGLSRLGYYQGPYDGVTSPALSLAIAAFQRDQGLSATGALDATVNQRLAAAAN
ncbi:MAG TPA: peptidoglycan-binding protein [Caulobacteraceae bacterium]|nr:peptidoglycan-binding protein [Caulobacteraceae bacterium]